MKYFIDTEFREELNTIDFISIGIVCEDGREYYTISKDFDLKKAWNVWQPRTGQGDRNNIEPKEYRLRENVLQPIFDELCLLDSRRANVYLDGIPHPIPRDLKFTYHNLKRLIRKFGKTNKEIAKEVLYFCSNTYFNNTGLELSEAIKYEIPEKDRPEFYGYYADYDWVVFCWLFGRMMDLPKGFPMYCKDLKQISDELYKVKKHSHKERSTFTTQGHFIDKMSEHPNYPRQINEHNALGDARWNLRLFKFLSTI